MLFALVALTLASAPETPASTPKKPAVTSVRVDTVASADANAKALADELRAAIGARKDEFRFVKAGETPELVVRIDGARPPRDGKSAFSGALVKGQTARPFSLASPGDFKALAALLARNLRSLADEMKATPPAAK